MKVLWDLFSAFFMIGAMTFGGGYAMLPMLQKEVVEKNGWATEEELMDYYAIGQCTPGVIAVNVSTFIGHKLAGLPGAIVASLGFISPSILIITLIAAFLESFASNVYVAHALAGIRVCVCVLILNAVVKLLKKAVIDKRTLLIFLLVLAGGVFLNISPVWFVILAALAGIFLKNLEVKKA